jgi:putative FmdB family regulatory protein
MPTYEYACEGCGHKFEQFQSITAKPLRVCPECGQQKLNRLIGAGAGIIFKGSGFYQTDYRSESYKTAKANDKKTTDSSTDKKTTETKSPGAGEKTKSKTKDKV